MCSAHRVSCTVVTNKEEGRELNVHDLFEKPLGITVCYILVVEHDLSVAMKVNFLV